MIVKIDFDGIVRDGKKKTNLPDSVRIHSNSTEQAKLFFDLWIGKADGIRGDTGIFHPVGDIKIKKVEEWDG